MNDKEKITDEEFLKVSSSFFMIMKNGFFKRNYLVLTALLCMGIAIFSISFELIDLIAENKFNVLNFIFVLSAFLYSFISLLIKEVIDKEVDRYFSVLTEIALKDIQKNLQKRLKKAEEINNKLEDEV